MNTALTVGAILAALAALLLRQSGQSTAAGLVSAVALIGILGVLVGRIGELWQGVTSLFGEERAALLPLLGKMLGIAWLAQIGADLCREFGSSSLAGYVEGVGKVELLLLTLPLIGEIIGAAEGLLS